MNTPLRRGGPRAVRETALTSALRTRLLAGVERTTSLRSVVLADTLLAGVEVPLRRDFPRAIRETVLFSRMNSKGQAGTIFKMLISTIIVFMLLIIIISAVTYFDNLSLDISNKRIFEGVQQAVKQPNGDVIKVADVTIKKDFVFSGDVLSEISGKSPDCFLFDGVDNPRITVEYSRITIGMKYSTDVFIRCEAGSGGCSMACDECCLFSVGKPIENI